MLLIYINDDTIHEMHTGNTYRRHAGSVEIISPAQHNDANYMMPNIICADNDAEIFWSWLKSQTMVPLPRMHALSPEIDAAVIDPAPVETPRKFKVGTDVVYRAEHGLRYTGIITGRTGDGWAVSLDTVNETIMELTDDQLDFAD